MHPPGRDRHTTARYRGEACVSGRGGGGRGRGRGRGCGWGKAGRGHRPPPPPLPPRTSSDDPASTSDSGRARDDVSGLRMIRRGETRTAGGGGGDGDGVGSGGCDWAGGVDARPPPPSCGIPYDSEAGSDGGASVAMGFPGYCAVGARPERWVGCGGSDGGGVGGSGDGHVRVNNSRNVGSSRRLNAQGVPCREETP